MRTFDLTLSIDVRVVVPQQFEDMLKADAAAEDASQFLQEARKIHPEGDEEGFLLFVLKHGLRRHVRQSAVQLFEESGLGGTLSPVTAVVHTDREPPATPPVLASEVAQAIPA